MSEIGNLFIAGAASGGAWIEFAPAAGVQVGVVAGSTICATSAGGQPVVLQSVPTGSYSEPAQYECRRLAVEQIAEGSHNAYGVTKQGDVYSWGDHRVSGVITQANEPVQRINTLEDIVTVSAGEAHCIAVRYDGSAYAFGSNTQGQLGLGSTSNQEGPDKVVLAPFGLLGAGQYQPLPKYISSLHRVRISSAACGSRFTLLLSDQGDLYGCGEGSYGQLGLGTSTINIPTRVEIHPTLPSATVMSAASSAGPLNIEQLEAQAMDQAGAVDTRVSAVSAGWAHTLILTRSGHVFGMGFNTHGQLGLGDTDGRDRPCLVYELLSLPAGEQVGEDGAELSTGGVAVQPLVAAKLACGHLHSACLSPDGRALTFGSSSDGRLGHTYDAAPASLAVKSVERIEATRQDGQGSQGGRSPHASTMDGSSTELGPEGHEAGLGGPPQEIVPGSYATAWPFGVNGQGPLRTPQGQDPTTPWQDPDHVVRNAELVTAKPAPAARVTSAATGRDKPSLDGVRDNTWSLPLVRTPRHEAMRTEAKAWAVARANAKAREPFEPVRDEQDLHLAALDALEIGPAPGRVPIPNGKPWLRDQLARNYDAPVTIPTEIVHPALASRPVVNLTCAKRDTVIFVPALLNRVVPMACSSTGGSTLTLSGPGLASVCKVPEASMHAALALAADPTEVSRIVNKYTPRRDETGLIPIPGVYVRFSCRFDDLASGTGDATAPDTTAEIHACKAYYPRNYDFAGFDREGRGEISLAFRPDGTLGHVGGTGSAGPVDMDCVQTIAPTVTRPCVATVEIVVLDATDAARNVFTASGPAVVRGSARFDYFLEPTLEAMEPSTVAVTSGVPGPIIRIKGDGLFGATLVDSVARPVAEALVSAVQEAVRAREAEEASRLAEELAALSSGRPAAPSKRVQHEMLRMSRVAGSAESPCDVIVSLDVLVNGQAMGKTAPLRGWFEMNYQESPLDVHAARAALTAAVRSASGSPMASTGLVPPTSTPRPAQAWGKPGALAIPGAGANAKDEGVDPDEPTIVGSYTAAVAMQMPDVSGMMGPANVPSAPADVQEAMAALARAAVDGAANPLAALDAAQVERLRSYDHTAAIIATATSGSTPKVTVRPVLSFNGGHDWVEAQPGVAVRALQPVASHLVPSMVHLQQAQRAVVYGIGLPVGAQAEVLVSTLNPASTEPVRVPATIVDECRVEFELPALATMVTPPAAPAEAAPEEGGEDAGLILPPTKPVGFTSVQISVVIGGAIVPSSSPLLITAYDGGARLDGPIFVPNGTEAGMVTVKLDTATLPQVDAVSSLSASAGAGDVGLAAPCGRASWIPPVASIGSVASGVADGLAVFVQGRGQEDKVAVPFEHNAAAGTIAVRVGQAGLPDGPFSVLFTPDGRPETTVVAGGEQRLYSPTTMVITAAGPKKIAPGTDLELTTDGFKTLLGVSSASRPASAATVAKKGGEQPAPGTASYLPGPQDVLVRISVPNPAGGDPVFSTSLAGAFMPDYTGVKTTLPGVDVAAPIAGAAVQAEISIDGGAAWSAPFTVNVAKKILELEL